MLTEIYIYKAADAFLYLPAYIAQELKIFTSLLKDSSVKVIFPPVNGEGDINAIQELLRCNKKAIEENRKNIIPICISDPTSFLSTNRKLKGYDINQCVVIGALIDKIPFWAVDKNHIVYESFQSLCDGFTDVVHYDESLITGYHLGKKFLEENKNCEPHISQKVGMEFKVLKDTYETFEKRGEKDRNVVALTADIVSVVKRKMEFEENLGDDFSINYYFSKEKESFVSTGILTTKYALSQKANHKYISKIIEGIQKSISIIESSEEIASDICLKVAKNKNIADIDEKVARKIIERINDENFYPANLNVDSVAWGNSVKALSEVEDWSEQRKREILPTSFDKFVNQDFLQQSLKSISNQFGITKETFRSEINDEIETITNPLIEQLSSLKSKYSVFEDWDKFTIAIGRLQVRIFKFFRRPFIRLKRWKVFFIIALLSLLVISFLGAIYWKELVKTPEKNEVITSIASCLLWINPVVIGAIFGFPSIIHWFKQLNKDDRNKESKKSLQ